MEVTCLVCVRVCVCILVCVCVCVCCVLLTCRYKALATVGKELMHFRPADEQNEHKVGCFRADADGLGTGREGGGVFPHALVPSLPDPSPGSLFLSAASSQVTCGVHVDVVEKVLSMIGETLAKAGVKLNLITSGSGDWRWAGKAF